MFQSRLMSFDEHQFLALLTLVEPSDSDKHTPCRFGALSVNFICFVAFTNHRRGEDIYKARILAGNNLTTDFESSGKVSSLSRQTMRYCSVTKCANPTAARLRPAVVYRTIILLC